MKQGVVGAEVAVLNSRGTAEVQQRYRVCNMGGTRRIIRRSKFKKSRKQMDKC